MRISDWSSDVCSSDLLVAGELRQQPTVSGMHARDHRRLIVDQIVVVRQAAAEMVEAVQHRAGADDRQYEHRRQQSEEPPHPEPSPFESVVPPPGKLAESRLQRIANRSM